MHDETTRALLDFTQNYCSRWDSVCGHPPASGDLYGVPSPCVQQSVNEQVFWLPQPFTLAQNLDGVKRALDMQLQPSVEAWYTAQFAGDMAAAFDGQRCTLLQTWSEEDFQRVQENLIGHLVMQRRLKASPTLFIATTDSELEVIVVCNLTGQVLLEQLGKKKRTILADNVAEFIQRLEIMLPDAA